MLSYIDSYGVKIPCHGYICSGFYGFNQIYSVLGIAKDENVLINDQNGVRVKDYLYLFRLVFTLKIT